MIPIDKAIELFEKMNDNNLSESFAKKCALIAVDEVIDTGCLIEVDFKPLTEQHLAYWNEVKKEIELL
jgi:hypothetical protein